MPRGSRHPIVSSARHIGASLPTRHSSSRRGDSLLRPRLRGSSQRHLLGRSRTPRRTSPSLRAHTRRRYLGAHIGHLCAHHAHHPWNPIRGGTRRRAWTTRNMRHQLRQRDHGPSRSPGRPARRPPRRNHARSPRRGLALLARHRVLTRWPRVGSPVKDKHTDCATLGRLCCTCEQDQGWPDMTSQRYSSVFRSDLFGGRVVVVTGGGSGIGRCVAHEVSSLGAQVVLWGRRTEALEVTSAEIAEDGARCRA